MGSCFLFGKEKTFMQEEIEEKTVRLAISGTRLTGRAIVSAITRTKIRRSIRLFSKLEILMPWKQ
jgi:hypothetical protein